MGLNDKQKRFCEEYIVDLNGTQAAIRAGYSVRSARTLAARILAKVDIKQHIEKLKEERKEKNKSYLDTITEARDRAAQRLVELMDSNVASIAIRACENILQLDKADISPKQDVKTIKVEFVNAD